jgi:hypothetical protein
MLDDLGPRPDPDMDSDRARLRFGILGWAPPIPLWQARVLEHIRLGGDAELVVLVIDRRPRPARRRLPRWRGSLSVTLGHVAWGLFTRRVSTARAMRRVPVEVDPDGVVELAVTPVAHGRHAVALATSDVERIRALRPDFLLRFGFDILRGEVLDVAPYGIWSFHHGDEQRYRGQPPGFWEIYEGDPLTGAVLQRITDRLDGGIILHKERFPTVDWSYGRQFDMLLLGSARWPALVCRRIRRAGSSVVTREPSDTRAPIRYVPTIGQFLRFLAIVARARARRSLRSTAP